ncbi:hypothetical protein TNCV_4804871 [Trichonephila clavipes]|nr:hypothetical protein TNCV_4804871 [Trichonephila clavipes]
MVTRFSASRKSTDLCLGQIRNFGRTRGDALKFVIENWVANTESLRSNALSQKEFYTWKEPNEPDSNLEEWYICFGDENDQIFR